MKVGHGYNDVTPEDLGQFPMESVSWDDAQLFLAELNERERGKQPGWMYRLPTETEWEYACRGGPMTDPKESTLDYYFETPITYVSNPSLSTVQLRAGQANFKNIPNGLSRTCMVGSYKPNILGLCDMHGNVAEWCDNGEDNPSPYVYRGGHWGSNAGDCRAVSRVAIARSDVRASFIGLRVARVFVGSAGR
jgi:formylglycine-generating enzyme required for sulfatase activity